MRITDVYPFPEVGQWWACKNPLLLHRVTSPGTVVMLKVWDPLEGITDVSFVLPFNENWTHLWFFGVVSLSTYFKNWEPLRVGDAFRTTDGTVLFIGGVDRKMDAATILSDDTVTIAHDEQMTRIQQGPVDPAENPPTSYDRLLREDSVDEKAVPESRERRAPITELEGLDEP